MASVAARLSPSMRCPYTSLVIAMLACPRTSETTWRGVPWASISEACARGGYSAGHARDSSVRNLEVHYGTTLLDLPAPLPERD